MVLPYKGRVERVETDMLYRYRNITTQAKPFTDRLPYYAVEQRFSLKKNMPWHGSSTDVHDDLGVPVSLSSNLILKGRDKFREKIGPAAMAAVNIAEYRSSMSMIGDRAMQLYRFTRYLRRFDLYAAARELNISPNAVDRRKVKGLLKGKRFGNAWLEYHFGWAPLIGDIGNCIDLLQKPLPDQLVKAMVTGKVSSYTQDQWSSGHPYGSYTETGWQMKIQFLADVSVDNPNLYRANRLGFTNPAIVAWELVPFSFVVDWFIPVGSFVSQFDDFLGLAVKQPMTTQKITRTVSYRNRAGYPNDPSSQRAYDSVTNKVTRSRGIATTYSLRPRLPWSLSPTRAATAISLLLQQLGR